jgi:hypothetical protein
MTRIVASLSSQLVIPQHIREAKGFAPDVEPDIISHRMGMLPPDYNSPASEGTR